MINLTEVPPLPDAERYPGTYPAFNDAVNEVRAVEEAGNPADWPTCTLCGHIHFFYPADKGYIEGHVYSDLGLSEIRITGLCEFCFDKVTIDPEEEDIAQ